MEALPLVLQLLLGLISRPTHDAGVLLRPETNSAHNNTTDHKDVDGNLPLLSGMLALRMTSQTERRLRTSWEQLQQQPLLRGRVW